MAANEASSTVATTVREIYKNGWLKKIRQADKRSGPFAKQPKSEKIWVVFCVHNEKDPFLEYYENRRSAYSHTPISSYSLSLCLHISPTIIIQDDDHEFAVTLGSRVIRLAAPTQELMNEWIDTLGNKLRELGILQPKDNVYSKEPTSPHGMGVVEGTTLATNSDGVTTAGISHRNSSVLRDPNSPLPPIPSLAVHQPSLPENFPNTVSYIRHSPVLPSTPSAIHSAPPDPQHHPFSATSPTGSSVFTFDFVNSALYETTTQALENIQNSNSTEYEAIFRTNLQREQPNVSAPILPPHVRRRSESEIQGRGQSTSDQANRVHLCFNLAQRPQSLNAELQSSLASNQNAISNHRATEPQQADNSLAVLESPPANEPAQNILQQGLSFQTMSLKQAQVQALSVEIAHRGGVRLLLRKKDSINAIALVECFGAVWVAGWKQKEHPLLHNTFHIGDKILTISGRAVLTVQEAQKSIKQQALVVEFVVQRLPHGRPMAIRRDYDNQDLGLLREGKSAEIKEVPSEGLAARHGLPAKSPTVDGNSLCNWMLTEVNGRPLNLFFRENEVHERLNAVGRDISILVQPSQLVYSIKKQLKALRNYKDFIVQ